MAKRRRIWLDPGLQARFTALIVGSVLGVLLVLGALYTQTLEEQRQLVGINRTCAHQALDDQDAEFESDLQDRLKTSDNRQLLVLVGGATALLLGLGWLGVRLTFHVVGPARAVSRALREMANGKFPPIRPLRKGDELRWLEDDLAAVREKLEGEAVSEAGLLEDAAAALGPGDLADRLGDLARRKRERFADSR